MKPLELTIYPRSRGWFGAQYDMPGGVAMLAREGADVLSRRKRLTGAELSAELWHSCLREAEAEVRGRRPGGDVDYWSTINQESVRQTRILERFVELPHYDEVTS